MLDKKEFNYFYDKEEPETEQEVVEEKKTEFAPTTGFVELDDLGEKWTSILMLNIRKSPSSDSEIIAQLKNGTKVNVVGSDGAFCKVELENGLVGYCMKTRIKI